MNPDACGVVSAIGQCRNAPRAACQYPLRGRKAGQVCGMKICRYHSGANVGDPPICPPHERLREAEVARRPAAQARAS